MSVKVSIDGPTAVGKTTLGTELARARSGAFLDTGLTYRAVALLLSQGMTEDEAAGGEWRCRIEHEPARFDAGRGCSEHLRIDGRDVLELIWSYEVDNVIDLVARSQEIRREILDFHQRVLSSDEPTFVAGRDVGTSLLRNANLHVVLTANYAIRRERRRAQHRQHPGRSVVVGAASRMDVETLRALEVKSRTIVIDTTHLPPSAVCKIVKARLNDHG